MAGETSRPGMRRWIGLLPIAVFLVSSALLLYWWQDLTAAQGRSMQEHFELDALRVETKISERLAIYDETLRGVAGLFAASSEVTRQDFHRYVDALQLGRAYEEIQGIGFALRIPAHELADHVRSVRAEGFPGYGVKPEGTRDEYTSVLFLEPFNERNRRAFGRDGFAEPTRRAAMELARDLAAPAATRKVTLIQEGESAQPGILIFFPVYAGGRDPGTAELRRGALRGWVYSPLQVKDFLERVIGQELQNVRLEVFDGAEVDREPLLYDSRPEARTPPALSTVLNLPVNQVSWTLRFTAGAPYLAVIRSRSPAVEFGFMTVIAVLLTGLSVAAVASWRARQLAVDLSGSLRESEARWRTTFERAPVGIFTVDAEDNFLQVNRRYGEITGYTPEELLRMRRSDIVHPDDRAADAALVRRVRDREIEAGSPERRGLRKDGTTFWAEATFSLEPAAPGAPAGMIGVLDDITARHEAEARFREIAEQSLAGIIIMQDGRVVYANPIVAEMISRKAREIEGRPADWLREHIHPDDLPAVRAAAVEAGAEVAGTLRPVVYRVRTAAGTRTVQQTARQIQHLGRPAMLVMLVDITEREKVEEELRKAQRLESLGIVAGGIAHDFNNLLTAVFGQVELAKGHVDAGSTAARELEVALSALERARDLTRQLLTFASGGAPARKILPVPRLLEDAVKLGLGGSSLRPRFELEPDLPPVHADEGQMSQLLNNLLVNARQATTGAGEVVVRARRRTVRNGELPGLGAGDYVEISIQDRGHGISPETLPRVFDPFYTTRPTGTGLGLATSHSIARRHGGHIGIASKVGEGTTVIVLLPASDGAPSADSPPPAAAKPSRRLRVLLMDDEPMVLKVGAKHLGRLGLEVETAGDGAAAVEKFRRHRDEGRPFDLAVLDLTVSGGMGGAQALQSMREIDPDVLAIACSGYFDAAVMSSPGQFGFAGVLAKPYLAADLERVLETVAGKARTGTQGA